MHGGLSTGPRVQRRRWRIAEAVRRRWEDNDSGSTTSDECQEHIGGRPQDRLARAWRGSGPHLAPHPPALPWIAPRRLRKARRWPGVLLSLMQIAPNIDSPSSNGAEGLSKVNSLPARPAGRRGQPIPAAALELGFWRSCYSHAAHRRSGPAIVITWAKRTPEVLAGDTSDLRYNLLPQQYCCGSKEEEVDIEAWLRSLGLEQYKQAFPENAIESEVLPGSRTRT